MAKFFVKGNFSKGASTLLIRTAFSIALYCPRCGKLNLHDVSHFAHRSGSLDLYCSCRYKQASVSFVGARQLLVRLPCVLCHSTHQLFFDRQVLRYHEPKKIYCPDQNFELGLIGRREAIEETLQLHENTFCQLWQEGLKHDEICRQRVLLEVLNKVHDIAAEQKIYCMCGAQHMTADILPEGILLTCLSCGGYELIRATEEELSRLYAQNQIAITNVSVLSHSE